MVRIAWNSVYAHELPEGHRFPMLKYDLIPGQLLHEGTIGSSQLFSPSYALDEDVLRVHDSVYLEKLKSCNLSPAEIRRTGFPLSDRLVSRELMIMQGTIDCAVYAIQHGIALNVAGGTHHAFSDRGEGFCLLNDIAIAAANLLHQKLAHRILVVDLDVHQGNGTAAIFSGVDAVFTFSVHGERNYPMHKEKSDLDVALPDGTDDETYLRIVAENFNRLIHDFQPDFIFYQCGVDVLSTDALGKLNLTMDGCKQRDRLVLEACHENKIPVCCVMGGGYSPDIRLVVEAHCNTFRIAMDLYS